MCVICIKPEGVEEPDKEDFRDMFISNSDGAGFMWVQDGKVHVRKGFMKFDDFWKGWNKYNITKDTVAIAHFRIGTSGGKTQAMTHPFPITDNEDLLKQTEWDGDLAMAHNGVFGGGTKDLSDTALFVRDIIHPLKEYLHDHNGEFDDKMENIIAQAADTSRVVLLNSKGNYMKVGDWSEIDGCWYSNTKWNNITSIYTYGNNSYYNRNYNKSSYKSNKPSKSKSTKKKASKTKDKKTEWSKDEIPGVIARDLMKCGIVLQRKLSKKFQSNSPTLYRWNKQEGEFQILWSSTNKDWKRKTKHHSIDDKTFTLPKIYDLVDDIYDAIENMLKFDSEAESIDPHAPIQKIEKDDYEELEKNLHDCYKQQKVIEQYEEQLETELWELHNIQALLDSLIDDVSDRQDKIEEMKDSVDLQMSESYKDLFNRSNGKKRKTISRDYIEKFGNKLVGTQKLMLQEASKFIDQDISNLSPSSIQKRLRESGYKLCQDCLKWRKFKTQDTICEQCRED